MKSWRLESGPIEFLSIENQLNAFHLRVRTRRDMPMYNLRCLSFRQGLFISRYVGTDRMRESAILSITRQRWELWRRKARIAATSIRCI